MTILLNSLFSRIYLTKDLPKKPVPPVMRMDFIIIDLSSFDFIVLEELNVHLNYHRYWWLSVLVIPCVMILTSFGWLPIHVAAVFGCAILLICRTITVDDAFESINLSVIFLIASLIPLGLSIQHTGLDDKIATFFLMIERMLPDGPSTQYIFLAIFY